MSDRETTHSTKNTKTAAPKTEDETAKTLKELIEGAESGLKDGNVKGTLADYVKLLQLKKDLLERTTEIKVTWVDPEGLDGGE